MFSVGDKIVFPMHGAGIIEEQVVKKIDGCDTTYYTLKLALNDMAIFLPTNPHSDLGIRKIVSKERACDVIENIPKIHIEDDKFWNRRHRDNLLKLRGGDINEVASVVKNLSLRYMQRGLSNGEKKMLVSAKQILISELILSLDKSYEEIAKVLDFAFHSEKIS